MGLNGKEKTVIDASNCHIFRKKKLVAKVRHNSNICTIYEHTFSSSSFLFSSSSFFL